MYEDHYGQHVALVRTVKTATGIIFSMQDFKDEVQLVDETFQNFNNGITIRTSNLAIGDYVFVQYQKRRSNPIQGNAYVLRIAD